MSSREFGEWMAYSAIEPFGEPRADLRAALVAKVIADVNRGKNTPPYKLEDFMLRFDIEPTTQSDDDMLQQAQLANAAYNDESRADE